MQRLCLVITAALSFAGCEYESPLSTDPSIPIDRAILGVWDSIDDSGDPHGSHEGQFVVLEFSPREYLVRDPDRNMFRGFLVDIGGHRCLQLQAIGSDAGPPHRGTGYVFGTYALDGDRLTFNLINDTHVPKQAAKTTADIRATILAKRDEADLFTPLVQMRRRILPTLRLAPPSLDDQQASRDFVETARMAPGGQRLVVGLRSGHIAVVDLVATSDKRIVRIDVATVTGSRRTFFVPTHRKPSGRLWGRQHAWRSRRSRRQSLKMVISCCSIAWMANPTAACDHLREERDGPRIRCRGKTDRLLSCHESLD